MAKKVFKWAGILLSVFIVIALAFYAIAYFSTQARINKKYIVDVPLLQIPTDSISYERGRKIATNRGCLGCHGANLGGFEEFLPEGSPMGTLFARNITSGKGGINYSDEDWLRVLRHGVNKEGKSVWFMPSQEVCHISNQEMGELIGFLKKQPPVDNTVPEKKLGPLGRVFVFLGKFPLLSAEVIDHNATYKDVITPSITSEYGAYLATTCQGCHSPNFNGGPPLKPGTPAVPNISATGALGKWEEQDFINIMRTGKRPDGKQVSDAMPYKYFKFSDDELKAIYSFLHQLK